MKSWSDHLFLLGATEHFYLEAITELGFHQSMRPWSENEWASSILVNARENTHKTKAIKI